MRPARSLALDVSTLVASVALAGCGDRTGVDGLAGATDGAGGGADASVVDASEPTGADAGPAISPDAVASVDAVAACNPQLSSPGPGCHLPSGRPCVGWCKCDDGCNRCACADGGYSQTDVACPPYGTGPACKGPLSALCKRFEDQDICFGPAAPAAYYCPGQLLAACGDSVCPSLDCTLNHTDGENGGTYWCCPQ
jgi:hypothetical protein